MSSIGHEAVVGIDQGIGSVIPEDPFTAHNDDDEGVQ